MQSPVSATWTVVAAISLPFFALQPSLRSQDKARERFDVAIGLLQRELWDDAARQFGLFLRDAPRHPLAPEARYRLGGCEEKLGNVDRAIDAYLAALESPGLRFRPECRYRVGKLRQQQKKFSEAAQQLQALVDEVEADHYLRLAGQYALGECLRDAGKPKQSVAMFLEAAKAEKDPAGTFGMPALYQAGFVLTSLEDHAGAASCFEEAARRFPGHEARAECQFLAGESAFRAGAWQRAIDDYEAAIQAGGPHVAEARSGLAWAKLRLDDLENAAAAFGIVTEKHPESPLAIGAALEQGAIYWQLGKTAPAITTLGRLLAREDLDGASRLRGLEILGLAQLDAGKAKDARVSFRKALQGDLDIQTKARIAFDLGEATSELSEWREAADAYGVAANAALGSKDDALAGDALYGASVALHELGEHAASVRMAGRIVDTLPEHRLAVQARFARAEGLFAMKKYVEAEADYAKISGGHELSKRSAFKHAWCAYLAGNVAEAAKRFEAVAGDESPFAEEALSLAALASFRANDGDRALMAADRYLARHPSGAYLARTERVAAQVLAGREQLEAATARVARAAAAEKDSGQQEADRLQMGELSFRRGDFEGAAKAYQAIAGEKSEVGAKALQGLAWCAFELGNDEDCARYVDAAIAHPQIGDGAPSMLELVSSLHHRAKQFDKAEIAARTFLNRFPKHPRAAEMRYALGVALARRDRNAEALATLEDLAKDGKAVQGLERQDRLWYELAWARRKQNDEKGALAAFAQVAASSKDVELVGEAKLHLGVAELAKLDGDAAGNGANGVNGANGGPKNAAVALSDAEQKQADARAAELLQATEGRYRAQALYRLGFSRFERGDLEGAAALFERILALGPDEAQSLYDEALFFAGECAYRRDDRNRARDAFVKLLERNAAGARAPMAKLHLGHVDLEDGRAAAAIRSLEEWILGSKDAPAGDRARAALWLGRARALRKDWDAAVASFEAATKLSDGPLGAEAQYRIGEARRDAGDLDGAIDAWLKLSILYGQPEWVQKGLLASAEGYLAQNQKEKARKLLNELVERFAKSDSAKAARNLLEKLSG